MVQARVASRMWPRVDDGDVVAERGERERDRALAAAHVEDAAPAPQAGERAEDEGLLDDALVDQQDVDGRRRRARPAPAG